MADMPGLKLDTAKDRLVLPVVIPARAAARFAVPVVVVHPRKAMAEEQQRQQPPQEAEELLSH